MAGAHPDHHGRRHAPAQQHEAEDDAREGEAGHVRAEGQAAQGAGGQETRDPDEVHHLLRRRRVVPSGQGNDRRPGVLDEHRLLWTVARAPGELRQGRGASARGHAAAVRAGEPDAGRGCSLRQADVHGQSARLQVQPGRAGDADLHRRHRRPVGHSRYGGVPNLGARVERCLVRPDQHERLAGHLQKSPAGGYELRRGRHLHSRGRAFAGTLPHLRGRLHGRRQGRRHEPGAVPELLLRRCPLVRRQPGPCPQLHGLRARLLHGRLHGAAEAAPVVLHRAPPARDVPACSEAHLRAARGRPRGREVICACRSATSSSSSSSSSSSW
mmetsp:Transcript_21040/g.55123  ORF Transcript_21040/g.55123 Transcript_21040/m.55123 type:complete len:327 (-) Transcript_21040:465-1445(-)